MSAKSSSPDSSSGSSMSSSYESSSSDFCCNPERLKLTSGLSAGGFNVSYFQRQPDCTYTLELGGDNLSGGLEFVDGEGWYVFAFAEGATDAYGYAELLNDDGCDPEGSYTVYDHGMDGYTTMVITSV